VVIKNFRTAVGVALVIGLLNATVGFLLRLPLNLITLFLLTFIVRLIVTAIVIKIAAVFFSGFDVKTFTAALILALAMAIAGAVFERMLLREKESDLLFKTYIPVRPEEKNHLTLRKNLHGHTFISVSDDRLAEHTN
jgi:putative membrane protein